MTKTQELAEKLSVKRRELANIFEQSKRDETFDLTADQLKDVQARNTELDTLHDEYKAAAALEDIYAKNAEAMIEQSKAAHKVPHVGAGGDGSALAPWSQNLVESKSVGELFIDSDGFKAYNPSTKRSPAVDVPFRHEVKTTLTETGFAPQAVRVPKLVPYPVRRVMVPDLIPQGTTAQIAIVYMEETTFTNNAAAVLEGGLKPEAAIAFTEQTAAVRKIAVTLPVTDELMMDAPALRSYIDARLETMVALKEEGYILSGTGTAPQIKGLLAGDNLQTQAKGADPVPTAIYKAMVKVQTVAFSEPSGYVTNPLDWQDIITLQDATGRYVWGDPSGSPVQRIWGLPVVSTTAMTQNTGLVGDFAMGAMIFRRQGFTLEVTNSNEDDFKYNILRIRAEERLALAIWRSSAFCQITGI